MGIARLGQRISATAHPTTGRSQSLANLLPLFVSLVAIACGGDRGDSTPDIRESPLSARPGERQLSEVEWESVFRIGGSAKDTTIYDPSRIVADKDGPFVYDRGRDQILRFSRSGQLEWSFGRAGKGPNELTLVRDLALDAQGRLWILDPDNVRATRLRRDGTVDAYVSLADLPRSDQIIPLANGQAALVTFEQQEPLYILDRSGVVLGRRPIPWDGYRRLNPLAAQMVAAGDRSGTYFAVAFSLGDGFFVFKHLEPLPYHGAFVEHTAFPSVQVSQSESDDGRIVTRQVQPTPLSAKSLHLSGDHLYVHFGGVTKSRHAIIDIYSLESGSYLHSLRLPRGLAVIAIGGGIVYGIYENPYPVVQGWRITAPEDARRWIESR